MSARPVLYPLAPSGIPKDLTTPPPRYRWLVVVVLVSLILFVLLYLALVAGAAWLAWWSITLPVDTRGRGSPLLKLGLIAGTIMLFLFLLKGLFKTRRIDNAQNLPIEEKDQPELYEFVRQLCRDTGAPFPRRIYLSPEVNAAVFYDTSLLSLFLPVRKNLLIGLGLVNMLNLAEFKAVLAHEFGHFSQRSMKLGTYVYTANGIITDMVYGRDYWDNVLRHWQGLDLRISFPAWGLAGVVWVLRKILAGIFRVINLGNLALMRQMEFHADLVAVSVTGSDSLVHALAKLDFANQSLMQAVRDLQDASDHQLYSADLFYHQALAADFLRKARKEPQLGQPPQLPDDPTARIQVFQPGESAVPTMWATHPSNYDREQNAKRHYVRSIEDERSPWLLFHNRDQICAAMTEKIYRLWFGDDRQVSLSPPEVVQQFIDEEHAEMTYDARYHGLYDGRALELTDLDAAIKEPHAPRERLGERQTILYTDQIKDWMTDHRRRLADFDQLNGLRMGYLPMSGNRFTFRDQQYVRGDLDYLLEEINQELEADRAWLRAFDHRVFVTYYQMASYLGTGLEQELLQRYRFHLGVQNFIRELGSRRAGIDGILQYLGTNPQLTEADMRGVLETFADAHQALENGLNAAHRLALPQMKNMRAGQPLDQFLLDEPLVACLNVNANALSGQWIQGFLKQVALVLDRLGRLHAKSLGGILTLQEKIVQEWEQVASASASVEIEG